MPKQQRIHQKKLNITITNIIPQKEANVKMFGLTDYEILRAERFGSRPHEETEACCPQCKSLIDLEYGEYFSDMDGQFFCSREHYCKYYTFGGED